MLRPGARAAPGVDILVLDGARALGAKILVAGGGLRTGQVVGSTDARGGYPKDRPLSPNDVWATVYRHLGIDQELSVPDLGGRPMPILPSGTPIGELLG